MIVYQAHNGLHLGRVYRIGQQNIEASKSTMTGYTKFQIQYL